MIHIQADKLQNAIRFVLEKAGSSSAEAQTVTEHLVMANLTGHDSHGVGMIPTYIKSLKANLLFPNTSAKLIKDTSSIMMFDGQRGYGQAVAKEAMQQALTRAKETGLVLMTLKNAHHIGRIGTYGQQAIDVGLISLHFVNVTDHTPMVAPYGGIQGRFVTNPICIAVPATEQNDAILLDMATSKIAMGKARVAMNKGVEVPEHSLLDAEGKPSNDPNVLFQEDHGALLPFGDYKGYGLALLCELLAGGLSGGGTIQPEHERQGSIVNNMFTIIVDQEQLVDNAFFSHEMDALLDYVKGTPAQSETGPVKIAGEPEKLAKAERLETGIPLAEAAWQGIVEAAVQVGVDPKELNSLIA